MACVSKYRRLHSTSCTRARSCWCFVFQDKNGWKHKTMIGWDDNNYDIVVQCQSVFFSLSTSGFFSLMTFSTGFWERCPQTPSRGVPLDSGGDLPASASPNQNTLPQNVPRQAQRAVHQLRVNRLTTTASYQALVGRCASPVCCTLWCGWWDSGMSTSFVP